MRHTKILCVVHLKLKFEWSPVFLLATLPPYPDSGVSPHWPLSPSSSPEHCSSGGAVCGMCEVSYVWSPHHLLSCQTCQSTVHTFLGLSHVRMDFDILSSQSSRLW